jgi:hypothetical protein
MFDTPSRNVLAMGDNNKFLKGYCEDIIKQCENCETRKHNIYADFYVLFHPTYPDRDGHFAPLAVRMPLDVKGYDNGMKRGD